MNLYRCFNLFSNSSFLTTSNILQGLYFNIVFLREINFLPALYHIFHFSFSAIGRRDSMIDFMDCCTDCCCSCCSLSPNDFVPCCFISPIFCFRLSSSLFPILSLYSKQRASAYEKQKFASWENGTHSTHSVCLFVMISDCFTDQARH